MRFIFAVNILVWCCLFSWGAHSQEKEALLSKQIAWAAANIENPAVTSAFKSSFEKFISDPVNKKALESPEGKLLLRQGRGLLNVVSLQEKLKKCTVKEEASQEVQKALIAAINGKAATDLSNYDPCREDAPALEFAKGLVEHQKAQTQKRILSIAQSQVQQTQNYWKNVKSKDPIDTAVELMEKERDLKDSPPKAGVELLLYTQAIKKRSNKNVITSANVHSALTEVDAELNKHQKYLEDLAKASSDEALQKLVVSNPAATAQYMLENPESYDLLCRSLQTYDKEASKKAFIDKAVFWGGLVVGGVLLATGIGAGVGAMVVSSATAATTLTTVAAGAALAGTVTAGGEVLYSSSKSHASFIEAQTLRSAGFSESSSSNMKRADKATDRAYDELAEAGFSAVSIVPFGAGFKYMKNAAAASKLGSASKVASEGVKVEKETVQALSASLKEISTDKTALKVLEDSSKQVSSEEMGTFLGYLSDLPAQQRKEVLEMIKEKPDRVAKSIRESTQSGVCR
ncbi:tolA protein [Bdellovibrio bacteriovorus]|uniref:tolA protein n=1 Tax=Bdellovibrio bacteriovorus TaxID=959 RepID=UPI000A8DE7ED|nr:tolA protein [Bdellovibrio bacteriovorus]